MPNPQIKQKMLKEAERVEARMNRMKPGDPRKGPLAALSDKLFRAAMDSE